jgi:TolB-like protein
MRTSISLRSLFATTVFTAITATSAFAGTGRIVVMGFEGPNKLADNTRAAIVDELSRNHDIVPPTTWVKARRAADDQEVGNKAWARASKKAKVDAVVQGKVVTHGRKATLSLTVVQAHDGTEIDTIEISMNGQGMTDDDQLEINRELDHVLSFVDDVASSRQDADPTDMDGLTNLDGEQGDRPSRDDRANGDDHADRDENSDEDSRDDRADDDHADRGADVMALFGDEAGVSPADSTRAADRATKAASGARMFTADAAAFAMSRTFAFQGGADAPADYPGSVTKGLALTAAVYPMSSDPSGKLGGFGVSLDYARGLGSTVTVDLGGGDMADESVIYQEWAAAAHYRYNAAAASIDGSVGYRSITHAIDVVDEVTNPQAGDDLDALDGAYGALTAGARIEFTASPKATLGLGAEYLYVTSVGVIADASMLGGGQAWGARAQADLNYNLSKTAYVHAAATLQRVAMSFDGSGDMDAAWQVDSVTDTFAGGQLGVGIKY